MTRTILVAIALMFTAHLFAATAAPLSIDVSPSMTTTVDAIAGVGDGERGDVDLTPDHASPCSDHCKSNPMLASFHVSSVRPAFRLPPHARVVDAKPDPISRPPR